MTYDRARKLRKAVIRLAHAQPELRPHLLPILKEAGKVTSLSMVKDIERKGLADKRAAKEAYAAAIRETDAANEKARKDFSDALVKAVQSTTKLQWRIDMYGSSFSTRHKGVSITLWESSGKWELDFGRQTHQLGALDKVQDIAKAVAKDIADSLG